MLWCVVVQRQEEMQGQEATGGVQRKQEGGGSGVREEGQALEIVGGKMLHNEQKIWLRGIVDDQVRFSM